MSRAEQHPVESKPRWGEGVRHDHPAFGTIVMTTRTGSASLFGSDLRHGQAVSITISRAHMRRDSRDWIHSDEVLLELEMSHAQFAQFITSNGNGTGTPVTLRYAAEPGSRLQDIPRIKPIEQRAESMRKEIQKQVREQIEEIRKEIAELRAMADSGKVGIKDLRAKLHTLACHTDNLPANLAYHVECAEEAMEKVVSDAKIEVEAHVSLTARRLGLENIAQLGLTMNNTKGIEDASDQG